MSRKFEVKNKKPEEVGLSCSLRRKQEPSSDYKPDLLLLRTQNLRLVTGLTAAW